MSFWFRTYRENVDDPQNSMLTEIAQLLIQTRQQQIGSTSPTDLEKKRVTLVTSESYLILISDGCFVIGKQRYLDVAWKLYLGREPDGSKCKCWYELEYRNNVIYDRALRDNNATLKGYPTIIAYQPEYPRSALLMNGTTTQVTVPHNSNIDNLTDFTVTFWMRPTSTSAVSTPNILGKNYPSNNSFLLYFSANSYSLNYRTVNNTGTGVSAVSTYMNTTGPNRYYFIAATFKASTGLMELFIDDVLRDSKTNTNCVNIGGVANLIMNTAAGVKWGGQQDDTRLYNRVLSTAELHSLFIGEEITPYGLLAQWHFDDDDNILKALDEHGYNSGDIVAGAYDQTNVPAIYSGSVIPYEDGMLNQLIGYKTDGNQQLVIPELQDDFRLTGKTTGGCYYYFVAKFTTFDQFNGGSMRLLQKADDTTLTYFQSIQIRSDGKLYFTCKFNGVEKKVRTVNALKLLKLYFIKACIDYDSIAGGNALNIFKIYLNGFSVSIEVTTEDSEYPALADLTDRHTYLMRGNEDLKGSFVGQLYHFRYYEEDITDANALGLMTNKFTTYNIARGHVAKSNMTKLPESTKQRFVTFNVPLEVITDFFTFTLTDVVKTGRYTSLASAVPISDDFDFFLSAPSPTLGNYAIDLTNTSNVHSWVAFKPLDPVKDHFSFFAWIKYRGKVGNWAGIISAIDGLDNGNRFLTDGTHLRYHGQFDKESNKWEDLRVTISDITNAWHLVGFTHDGDDKKFKIWLDGKLQKTFKIKGDIRGTDRSDTFLGKGANTGFYFDGLIDDVFIYNRTLTQNEVGKLWMKNAVTKSLWVHYRWERTSKDEKKHFHSKLIGTINYSSDHV